MSSTSMPAVLERAQVEDALVRHAAVGARVEHRVVRLQPLGDVVGVEDRHLRGRGQPSPPIMRDVGPGDRQDAGAAPGAAETAPIAPRRPRLATTGMAGQEGRQVRRHADRAHARAAAAVRNAEGLVQVQVADVGADVARAGSGPTCAFMLAPSM